MNIMKFKYLLTAALALSLLSCAQSSKEGKNDAAKAYFDAWVSQNYPNAVKTPLGVYILSDTPGAGALPGNAPFVRLNYSYYTLSGDLVSTTREEVARQNDLYSKTAYYGPGFGFRGDDLSLMSAGLEETVAGMRVGGRRIVAVPGWLDESERYDTEEEYLEHCSGTDYIYDIELVEAIDDVEVWEQDSLARYMARNYPEAREDSLLTGFYYICLDEGNGKPIANDSTVYVNYTGRRLDGVTFDTTVADTAKVWGLSKSSFSPAQINWFASGGDYTSITMGSDKNDALAGFAYALSKMHQMEKGICFFCSTHGYSSTGSGTKIPAYCPLIFELEMTEEP